MIQAAGLSKRYGPTVAVDHISFEVAKGDIAGFLGPNGAGKTTTMRMLTCFMPPTAGTANIAGFDVVRQPEEVKRRIGYLPETPPLYPDLTVAEYLEFVAKLKGIRGPAVAQRLAYAIERCALTDVRDKLISKLSKGFRQRTGLAQAIIHNPDVLILDEPTSGFDPKQINEFRELIRGLGGDHTIILSTHILSEVEAICQQVVIINKGRLAATDSVANLTARLRGGDAIRVQFTAPDGHSLDPSSARQRLESIPGVSTVGVSTVGVSTVGVSTVGVSTVGVSTVGVSTVTPHDDFAFDIELLASSDPRAARAELARAVVQSGWNLLELRTLAYSLEDIFLELTSAQPQPEPEPAPEALES